MAVCLSGYAAVCLCESVHEERDCVYVCARTCVCVCVRACVSVCAIRACSGLSLFCNKLSVGMTTRKQKKMPNVAVARE